MMRLTTTAMTNLKGGYIPKDKERISSYKLTNEGYALLNLVERVKGQQQEGQQQNKNSKNENKNENHPKDINSNLLEDSYIT